MSIGKISSTGISAGSSANLMDLVNKSGNIFSSFAATGDASRDFVGINSKEAAESLRNLISKHFTDENSGPRAATTGLYNKVQDLRTTAVKGKASEMLDEYTREVKNLIDQYIFTYENFIKLLDNVILAYQENDTSNARAVEMGEEEIKEMASQIQV